MVSSVEPVVTIILAPNSTASAVFTKNKVVSASVSYTKKVVKKGVVSAVVVNSGNANCFTGQQGFEDCEKLVNAAVEAFGEEIDALINNAGITNNCNFIDLEPEQYEAVINTNLVSMMHMSHLCLPYMVDNGDASITCTASVGGMTGVINQGDYCAAKTGVIGLVRALALEFAPRQVRVNAIAPGMIMTDMLRGVNQDELNALAATIPLGRIGDVSDIAGALDYILDATYLTGQTISPNGGFVLQ